MSKHEEREQRLVHRIEAFSDLVMGFSLALLSLSLVIPHHAIELILDPIWIASYVWTFAWIASTWFAHQRLFSLYFVPSKPAIVINFVLLASLALGVYFVQVFLHALTDPDKVIAILLYFAALSVTLLSLGTLYAIGTKGRWELLDLNERYFGVLRAMRLLIIGGSLLGGIMLTPVLFVDLHFNSTLTIAYAVFAGVIVSRLGGLLLKRRMMGGAHAAA